MANMMGVNLRATASFMVPSVSHVMAEVPVVGQLYSNFNDLIGRNLAS